MRKLGLVGGLSWTSTARYYEIINSEVQRRRGGLHSARLVVESLDFADLAHCLTDADWGCAASQIVGAAKRLEGAGCDGLLICANSMHKLYEETQGAVGIPVIHIVDVLGAKLKADGIKTAALLGTSNVMTDKGYRQRLVGHGVQLIPADTELAGRIDRMVYEELAQRRPTRDAERFMKSELTDIAKTGAQAAILACTELEMIVDISANVLPIYDGATIHSMAGVDFLLGE